VPSIAYFIFATLWMCEKEKIEEDEVEHLAWELGEKP